MHIFQWFLVPAFGNFRYEPENNAEYRNNQVCSCFPRLPSSFYVTVCLQGLTKLIVFEILMYRTILGKCMLPFIS